MPVPQIARPCCAVIEDHCIITRGVDVVFDGLLDNLALVVEILQPGDLVLLHPDDFVSLRNYLAQVQKQN